MFHWRDLLHWRSKQDHELDKELRAHVDLEAEELQESGVAPAEAHYAAQRAFGNTTLVKEDVRALSAWIWFETLFQDFGYGLRQLRKSPGFTAAAVLTLALGIGATTAIFSVVDSLLIAPFPYKDFDRVVTFAVHDFSRGPANRGYGIPIPILVAIREQNHSFQDVLGFYNWDVRYNNGSGTRQFSGAWATPNVFAFYGVPALRGRWFAPEDAKPSSSPVFLISFRFWQNELGGDPAVVGKTFSLNNKGRTLIGIMPENFEAFYGASLYVPLGLYPGAEGGAFFGRPSTPNVIGRLKPGVSLEAAAADLDAIVHNVARLDPKSLPERFSILVESLADYRFGSFRKTLYPLVAAVSLLLLIACSNVANLLLARATARQREISVRASLGASRFRLVRQLLTESLILAMLACALGCGLAYVGLKAVLTTVPKGWISAERTIGLSVVVLCFSIGVSLLTTLLCGLAPALHAVWGSLQGGLASGGKASSGRFRQGGLRSILVVGEIAISIVLLVGATLMIQTVVALAHVDLGVNPAKLLYAMLATPVGRYDRGDQKKLLIRPILDRVSVLPGVLAAAESTGWPPGSGGGGGKEEVTIVGEAQVQHWTLAITMVSEDYFKTLGLSLLRGRWMTETEADAARHVIIINETLARRYFPNEDPVGQKVEFAGFNGLPDTPRDVFFEIIGVVSDCKNDGLRNPAIPQVYLPYTFTGVVMDRTILVRTTVAAGSMLKSIAHEAWAVDPDVGFRESGTVESSVRDSYKEPRFVLNTLSLFGAIGLLLVSMGIFGLMAYTVSLRTHELGIRMALGAQRRGILGMIVAKGIRLIGAGIIIGLVASYCVRRLLASEVWGISTTDPSTFIVVTALVLLVGIAACYLPALRAANIDPLITLRNE